jgi:hypothetical protein
MNAVSNRKHLVSDDAIEFLEKYRAAPEWGKRRLEFLLSFFSRVVTPTDPDELHADIKNLFLSAPQRKKLSTLKRECWSLVAKHRTR